MARLEGFEPPTYGFVVRCSIQLSYKRKLVFAFKLKRSTNSLKNSGAHIKLLVIWESVSAALAYLAAFAQ
jgi:hypothetical protein